MADEFNENVNILLGYLEKADYYKSIKDYQAAIDCYEKFLEIDNTKVSVLTLTADLYSKLNGDMSLNRQIELYEQAFKLQPENRLALHGLAFGYERLGRNILAKIYYEKLLRINPTENDFFNYGAFLIHCGDFINGHKYFTHRFNIDDINLKYPSDISKKWDFESDLSDKVLLVHYEQGFGDTIMYSRFVPLLKKIAKKVIFVVQDELFDLISNSQLFNNIIITTDKNAVDYDANIALLDVPYVIKLTSETLSLLSKPYLNTDNHKIKNYYDKYIEEDANCFKIGISCCGEKQANYNDRNIEISKIYNLLKDISNIKLYNLQKDGENISGIRDLGTTFNDFTDSACALKNMNLIISTDNVILNLAGALGVKTIGLFNKETNFRWFKTQGDNAGWYECVKPLQAAEQNKWDDVLEKLLNIIKKEPF